MKLKNRPCPPLREGGNEAPSGLSWIIFSYFFNIDGKASSQHIDDRIPHLVSLGVKPAVVSSVCAERNRDVAHYRVPSVAPSGIRFELRYLKRRNRVFKFAAIPLLIVILPFYFIEKAIINIESEWSWFPLAFLRGLLLYRKRHPELIYSTGGPPSAHLAAGLLASWVQVPWIAELQDPIVFKTWRRSKAALKIYSRLERFIIENASAVVFLTEGARELAVQRINIAADKTEVIYPGACPLQMPRSTYSRQDACHFAHFGSFGGSRNPEKLLQATQILLDQKPDSIEKMRLDFYGTIDSFTGKLIEKFKYGEVISNFGKVQRLEALEAMRKSDVLVLIENPDESYETIPAKIYEYLQLNRPILGLTYHNPYLKEMLLERGHFVAQGDSPAGIGSQIALILERWRRGDLDSENFPSSPYTVRAAAEKLLAIAKAVRRDERRRL